jgi:protein-arginine kinase activator protein McsA
MNNKEKHILLKKLLGENGLCQFCEKEKAEIPIQDSETLKELWICESCDKQLFNEDICDSFGEPKDLRKRDDIYD